MSDIAMEQLTPIKRALLEIRELRARLQQAESRYREPIAVVGIGLRFPGGASDLASFWQLLAEGKDAISEIPPDRWDRDAYFDPNPDQPLPFHLAMKLTAAPPADVKQPPAYRSPPDTASARTPKYSTPWGLPQRERCVQTLWHPPIFQR